MQNHDFRGRLPRISAVLGGLLLLSACSSSSRNLVVSVNPPEASVYINGELAGKGNSRPHELSFANCERIYIQATAPNFEPRTEWFTMKQLDEMIDHSLDINITLRQR
jgi:hypothetical protein